MYFVAEEPVVMMTTERQEETTEVDYSSVKGKNL